MELEFLKESGSNPKVEVEIQGIVVCVTKEALS